MARPSIRDQVNLDDAAAVAVDDESQAGPGVLGKIVFYAVADTIRVAADELERLFVHYRIAESYLPKTIDPAQSLRSVVGSKEIAISLGGADHVVAFREETKLDGSLFIRMFRSRPRSLAERRKLTRTRSLSGRSRRSARLAGIPKPPTRLTTRSLRGSSASGPTIRSLPASSRSGTRSASSTVGPRSAPRSARSSTTPCQSEPVRPAASGSFRPVRWSCSTASRR